MRKKNISEDKTLEPKGKTTSREYDVALSFASEDKGYVEKVVEHLKVKNISYFYADEKTANLWGENMHDYFAEVYGDKSKYFVMFISKDYKRKKWPIFEGKIAQAAAMERNQKYILPARIDDTEIPGILTTTHCIDLRNKSPFELVLLIADVLGVDQSTSKSNAVPPPKNPFLHGEGRFDYSNNDGRYCIGEGKFKFTTQWTERDNASIYCYNDPPEIKGIALVPKNESLSSVSSFNFTSRFRTPIIGQFVVLQNTNEMYALLKILGIKARGNPADELHFEYWINKTGSDNFSYVADGL